MKAKLSDRVRPNSEVPAWIYDEIKALENENQSVVYSICSKLCEEYKPDVVMSVEQFVDTLVNYSNQGSTVLIDSESIGLDGGLEESEVSEDFALTTRQYNYSCPKWLLDAMSEGKSVLCATQELGGRSEVVGFNVRTGMFTDACSHQWTDAIPVEGWVPVEGEPVLFWGDHDYAKVGIFRGRSKRERYYMVEDRIDENVLPHYVSGIAQLKEDRLAYFLTTPVREWTDCTILSIWNLD